MSTVEIVTTNKVVMDLDLELLAQFFSEMSDDEQCRFFVAVTAYAKKDYGDDEEKQWNWSRQWFRIGSHLRNCKCSTDEARDMIAQIHKGMLTGNH